MSVEERAKGAVKEGVYLEYIRRGGGFLALLPLLCLHLVATALMLMSNVFVGLWTADAAPRLVPASAAGGNATLVADPSTTYATLPFVFYVGGYAGLALLVALFTYLRTRGMAAFCLRASRQLHTGLVAAVMRAPLSFFDTTPIGRIVSRFSKDMYSIDQEVLEFGDFFIFMSAMLLGSFAIIAAVTPWFVAVLVPLALVYLRFVYFFRAISRESKRLESIARSPVFAHYSETLGGISTIRAYAAEGRFAHANLRLVDALNEAYYLNKVSERWLSVRLELIGAAITLTASLLAIGAAILQRDAGDETGALYVGLAGASLSGSTSLVGVLNFVMRSFGQVEAAMTCTERVVHYIRHIPQEAAEVSATPPPAEWPQAGAIEIHDLRMRYRDETPLVLRGLSVAIGGGQRVGIVGRTGSGKSSLLLSLLRLVEPLPPTPGGDGGGAKPAIAIDGVDISALGLFELRKKLAIIPQSPALFSGTIRSNVDPFDDYTDEQIWAALDRCEMKQPVLQMVKQGGEDAAADASAALAAPVAEYGENLSQGQRQLLCLARAVLDQARVLILDEATSAVDYATDAKIQAMIRTVFASCTILVIAHRINTVIDSDLILVLGDGQLLESGSPAALLDDKDSAFSKIVAESKSSPEQ